MMKKAAFILSLAINVVLVWFILSPVPKAAPATSQSAPTSIWRKSRLTLPTSSFVTNVVAAPIHWSQIESADYLVFIKNLRALRCPKTTIRDIIVADVEDNFSQRREATVREPVSAFWQLLVEEDSMEKMVGEKEPQLRQLHSEKEDTLAAILGPLYESKSYFNINNEAVARLGFLSEQKREQVLALREQFEGYFLEAHQSRDTNVPPLGMRLEPINSSFEKALAKILNSSELEEYELQMAPAAQGLRRRLDWFGPTESEFRKIYAIQKPIEADHTNLLYAPNNLSEKDIASIQNTVDEQFILALSPERRADFERSQKEDFRRLYAFTQRLDLPRETAVRLHDIEKEIKKKIQQLQADRTLSQEERTQQLDALEPVKTEMVLGVIGESNYNAFKENGR
ncbi:MAG: hypothetical protein JWM68_4270 [Verrucomicrobiales bacterium]|nr:hypothetical protein [Verrucomicrobiales bacterium]